jgi:hypothetical protein
MRKAVPFRGPPLSVRNPLRLADEDEDNLKHSETVKKKDDDDDDGEVDDVCAGEGRRRTTEE